jgi:hypothetical protein
MTAFRLRIAKLLHWPEPVRLRNPESFRLPLATAALLRDAPFAHCADLDVVPPRCATPLAKKEIHRSGRASNSLDKEPRARDVGGLTAKGW